MKLISPPKLKKGDWISVVAPSSSASLITSKNLDLAKRCLEGWGLKVVYGKHIFNKYRNSLEGIRGKLADLHTAFSDKRISAVMSVIGGYSANELLPYLNYHLFRENPKIFVGYSDTTVLQNAIFEKSGLITFSGPAFATLAQTQTPFEYEKDHLKHVLMNPERMSFVKPAKHWAEDAWWKNPKKPRQLHTSPGWRVIYPGKTRGVIVGGNLSSFLLLLGTPCAPSLRNKIIFLEEDPEMNLSMIQRSLVQVSQNKEVNQLRGVIVGRFSSRVGLRPQWEVRLLKRLFRPNVILVSNVDFGHTNPMITFPVGGECEVDTAKSLIRFKY